MRTLIPAEVKKCVIFMPSDSNLGANLNSCEHVRAFKTRVLIVLQRFLLLCRNVQNKVSDFLQRILVNMCKYCSMRELKIFFSVTLLVEKKKDLYTYFNITSLQCFK